jgi:hypothetical protein
MAEPLSFAILCAGPSSCRISGIPTDQRRSSHATSGFQRQMAMSASCGPASSGGSQQEQLQVVDVRGDAPRSCGCFML